MYNSTSLRIGNIFQLQNNGELISVAGLDFQEITIFQHLKGGNMFNSEGNAYRSVLLTPFIMEALGFEYESEFTKMWCHKDLHISFITSHNEKEGIEWLHFASCKMQWFNTLHDLQNKVWALTDKELDVTKLLDLPVQTFTCPMCGRGAAYLNEISKKGIFYKCKTCKGEYTTTEVDTINLHNLKNT